VLQVGYLQRLYRDARSTEHKIHLLKFAADTQGQADRMKPMDTLFLIFFFSFL